VQPIVYGKLKAIQKVLGKDEFPLIEQAYVSIWLLLRVELNANFDSGLSLSPLVSCYADWKAMTFCSGFPIVAKLGTAHAGA
jgi:hypothetical protein